MSRITAIVVSVIGFFVSSAVAEACSYTPLEWQTVVDKHAIAAMVGQPKHLTWIRDRNRNFVDDEIESRFRTGELVNIIVDLNTCLTPPQIRDRFSPYGKLRYIGKVITFVVLDAVRFENLHKLSQLPEVAMIEWQAPLYPFDEVSGRALQSRASVTYSPKTAQDAGFDGSGVTVAIVDSGVDTGHSAFTGKLVAGYNALTNTLGTPPDDVGHGTLVAGIALGAGVVGLPANTCRSANDGSPSDSCAGVAPGAGLVSIKICDATFCTDAAVMAGLDWLASNAKNFNIRVANMSIGGCVPDDGTSALAQQVNYAVALGVAFTVSAGNANSCLAPPGSVLVGSPASSSFAITVGGTFDQGTISRTDDTNYSGFLRGPRNDFNLVTPDLLALKPDISAPGQDIYSPQSQTTNVYVSHSGTSLASPHVAGAEALIIQARPNIDPDSLKDLLKRFADTSKNSPAYSAVDPNWDTAFGAGMLNVSAALEAAATTDVGFPSCVGPPATPGQPCALAAPLQPWENTIDVTTASAPKVGVANTINVQVQNSGAISATVLVNFGVYVFAVGNNQFHHLGTQQVAIPPGNTVTVTQDWTPAAADHQCAQISIAYGLDTNYGNNVTQRNIQVAPSVFQVRVENPFFAKARFRVQAESDKTGWACKVGEPAFVIDPFEDCPKKLRVTFDPPLEARPGESANCKLAVYGIPEGQQKERLIGGVTMRTFVPKPCRLVGSVVDSKGNPIAGARVSFARFSGEAESAQRASQDEEPHVTRATSRVTDADGVLNVEITPSVLQTVTVEKAGVGMGSASFRPHCGVGTVQFVLRKEGVKVIEKN